jgi:serine kinase of HPr protein (carbohydrate metabolism regulator)
MENAPTIHATAVLVGAEALLIRGAAGSGKSRLALRLLQSATLPLTRLVGDDRVHVEPAGGRLLVRPAPGLAGLIEVRGLGICRMSFEPVAVVGLIVDLAAHVDRLPDAAALETCIYGVSLPRLATPPDSDPLPLLLTVLGRPAPFDREDSLRYLRLPPVGKK